VVHNRSTRRVNAFDEQVPPPTRSALGGSDKNRFRYDIIQTSSAAGRTNPVSVTLALTSHWPHRVPRKFLLADRISGRARDTIARRIDFVGLARMLQRSLQVRIMSREANVSTASRCIRSDLVFLAYGSRNVTEVGDRGGEGPQRALGVQCPRRVKMQRALMKLLHVSTVEITRPFSNRV